MSFLVSNIVQVSMNKIELAIIASKVIVRPL